jgi:DNA polymerase-3 subunit epsilon
MSSQSSALIGVVDVETTGLFTTRHDRVVEVAAVVMQPNGHIEREFVSLVNPGRDIGPTHIHGLTTRDVLHAPLFEEIAAELVEALRGIVALAAHNVRFDRQFLEYEFSRMGCAFPDCSTICTMVLAGGGNLKNCCTINSVPFDGEAHTALFDARATARLLAALLSDEPRVARELNGRMPIEWPGVRRSGKQPVTRDESQRRQAEPPTYLQRLLSRIQDDGSLGASDSSLMAYSALLDRVLEDRRVDESEGDALVETAVKWGLSKDQIDRAHKDYLNRLAVAAVADGIVSDVERWDLQLVSRLLGQARVDMDEILRDAAKKVLEASAAAVPVKAADGSMSGKSVCFTGELRCRHRGQEITRELAEVLVQNAGLIAASSVTKKLDILVVADPDTQSGKAQKARKYGIRIMYESAFWKAIGVEVE